MSIFGPSKKVVNRYIRTLTNSNALVLDTNALGSARSLAHVLSKKNITVFGIDKNIEQKEWDMKKDVGFGNSKISLNKLKEEGVFDSLSLKAPITLKPFRGNERMMLNKTYYQELKKIFQHRSIPIWERDKFILFYSHNELLLAYSDKEMFISSEIR